MVNLTVSLSEGTARKLRRTVRDRYGSRREALSGLIEEAVLEALERFETPSPKETFRALKRGAVVAQADTLTELASKLRKLHVDARSVRILSSCVAPVARVGFRARSS